MRSLAANAAMSDLDRGFHLGSRFTIDRVVKRAASTVTYLGTDASSGRVVVIKTANLRDLSSGAAMRLRHEAEVLRQIECDSLARLLEVGEREGVLYLVMPFISGISLESRLREGRLTPAETLLVGIRVLEGLRLAHAHGILHRDIKPANIVVSEGPRVESATLIDFGLARSLHLDGAGRQELVGAARYMAPEQAGLLDRDVNEAADLYSVGIVLYECLTGQHPFSGETVGDMLRQHITVRVPELRGLGIAVPRVLDEAIQRLVRKDPRDRYQTAQGVLADLTRIAQSLGEGDAEPAFVVGLHDSRDTLTEPAFVGRGGELQQLERQIRAAAEGRGGLVTLEAESGFGKTRLLDEFTRRASQQALLVVHGRALGDTGRKPLQALEGLLGELAAECRDRPELLQRIRARLEQKQEIVGNLLPGLARLLGLETASPSGPEHWGENLALTTLSEFLDSLGTPGCPAIVILDDCQWADDLSLQLLRHWSRPSAEQQNKRHVLLIASFRSEEVDSEHPLRQLQVLASLRLAPLTDDERRELAISMAGALPEEVHQLLARLSAGSPFMVWALLHGLAESGALLPDRDGWRIEPLTLKDVQSSRHAAAFLARRMKSFPTSTIDFLTVGAVLGKEFPLSLAATLAGHTPKEAFAAVNEARRRHVLWSRDGIQCVFVHDRLRQTLVQMLDQQERTDIHHRAAVQLEQDDPQACFDLAYHFDAAGEPGRALPYALRAAEQARAQHSLAIAEVQYGIAERAAEAADRETRYRIATGQGDVRMLQGRYDDAEEAFGRAASLAEPVVQQVEVAGRLGELAHKRGDMKTASACIEQALHLLGKSVPRGRATVSLWLAWETLVQIAHTAVPALFLNRRPLEGAEVEFLAIQLLRRLSYAYWFSRGTHSAVWAHLRGMNLAERYPETLELAYAYANHAPAMSALPWYGRGDAYARRSLEIRSRFHDTWGQAHSLSFHGIVLHAAGRFADCIQKCREAIRLFERTGDYWEMTTARYELALSLYRLGDLREAVKEAQLTRQIGLEHGDAQASGMSLDVWVRASRGRVAESVVREEVEREREDPQTTAQVLLAEGVQLYYADNLERSIEVMERARTVVTRAGIRHAWVAAIWPWLATVRRQLAERTRDRVPARRDQRLRQAARAARRAVRMGRVFPNELPHALREWGLVAALQGRTELARKRLDRSLHVARRQQARYEEALTRKFRGEIGQETGWQTTEEDLAVANGMLREIEAFDEGRPSEVPEIAKPTTLSLLDRFDTVLEAGRRIASEWSRETIFTAVREAGMRLLRGETCHVVELLTPGELDTLTITEGDPSEAPLSIEALQTALEQRQPVTLTEALSSGGDEGELLSGIRSTLCAPILVRKQVAGFIYVTHREVVGLFGEDEERLAAFIATIAGAALENARGFNELQQLNATLELHVAERTADLRQRSHELARSNEDLKQFAYVASHDLQEPLRTVASYCQLLRRRYHDQLDDSAQEFIEIIVDGAGRMKTLIDDLLTYSRVGTQGKPFEPIDFNNVLDNALRNLRVAIQESQAVISRDELPVLAADGSQMVRLFQNLIANAIKFRGNQTPRIHIGATQGETDWTFSVRDNGIGIPAEHQQRVFQIFQRLHTREEYSGTGIGLAVCQKTVERHGGRIWVESEPGQGSLFCFTVPLHIQAGSGSLESP